MTEDETREILRDADELSAHLWRIPIESHPRYKRAINRLLALIVTSALLLVGAFVSPLGAQRVELRVAGKVAPDSLSLFQYDTLYQIEAVALDTRGRRAPSAKPRLDFHMYNVAAPANQSRAKADLVGVGKGTAMVLAIWTRTDGHYYTDTLRVGVPRARTMAMAVCFDFVAVRQCVPRTNVTVGNAACAYVTAQDRRGGYITGLDPALRSSDTHVAALRPSLGACPDTTVNPYKLTYPLPRPR